MDHQHVGWYQSSQFGNFLSSQLLESQFSYQVNFYPLSSAIYLLSFYPLFWYHFLPQTSIEESVCLIFDTAKTSQGFLSVKAYRMTKEAIK